MFEQKLRPPLVALKSLEQAHHDERVERAFALAYSFLDGGGQLVAVIENRADTRTDLPLLLHCFIH
jgi:hypothetical protein